jgi:hypothetical protein
MRSLLSTCLVVAVIAALASGACGDDEPKKKQVERGAGEASAGFYGVDPSVFRCDAILPPSAVGSAIGGEVVTMDSMFTPPKGTPAPCDFRQINVPPPVVQDGAPAPALPMWSIRFDCRESYMSSTEKEMKRLIAEEGALEVTVGRWGVEHRDAALVFVDDNAPCTVRIVGPGSAERQAIGRLVADVLTPKTAPMTPRPM